jgi:hypothetical protein
MKTIWIEILLLVAIVSIPAFWILRIKCAGSWIAWEYQTIERWGINATAYTAIKILLLISIGVHLLIKDRRKRKEKEARFYSIPRP